MVFLKGNPGIFSETQKQNISLGIRAKYAAGWKPIPKGTKYYGKQKQNLIASAKKALNTRLSKLGKNKVCPICLRRFRQITSTHLIKHSMTPSDYKKLFPERINDLTNSRCFITGKCSGTNNPNYGKKHPEVAAAVSKANKGNHNLGGWLGKHLYPETIEKILRNRTYSCPNNFEKKLIKLIDEACPSEYKFVGDGSFIIGGLNPDFANINGKKKLIEGFGDYYHSPKMVKNNWKSSELGRIMIYNSYGFDSLIIWEHELQEKSDEELIEATQSFNER